MTYDKPEMPASQESNQIADSAYQALFAASLPPMRAINDEPVKPISSNSDKGESSSAGKDSSPITRPESGEPITERVLGKKITDKDVDAYASKLTDLILKPGVPGPAETKAMQKVFDDMLEHGSGTFSLDSEAINKIVNRVNESLWRAESSKTLNFSIDSRIKVENETAKTNNSLMVELKNGKTGQHIAGFQSQHKSAFHFPVVFPH